MALIVLHSDDGPMGARAVLRILAWAALPLVLLGMSSLAAADPSASSGKAISGQCAACHGSNGMAVNSQYPNLAGQNYQYLVQALEHFKQGERNNSIMHGIASGLSKGQIQNLAAYFSSVQNASCGTNKK
ncbi:MAG: cytochrome c [Salinisphaera sp.]|nr:cytochrome c [Salinisphaera sp.]